jgi:hypothetical protein
MPININGIPYNTDYMQYYRLPLHEVRFFFKLLVFYGYSLFNF